MNYKIRYGGALIGKAEINAITRIVKKNYWPAGPEVEKMEAEAAHYLNVRHGILTNSGSSAGLLALTALELPPKSEVLIPAVTFPTIFNIILQCNLIPVVVDCEVGTYNIDVTRLEQAITKKTKAIICVHAVGNPCDMHEITKIAKRNKLYVIEDNCDGWGGKVGKRNLGSFGHVSFTSFHAAHIVAMGQGGGVFTSDTELARKVRMYRDWGRQSDIKERRNNDKWPSLPKDQDARFIYEKIGYNLGPLELQAAMGRIQLKKTEKIKRLRRRNHEYLTKHLKNFSDLILPRTVAGADPSWFSLGLSTKAERAPLIEHLERNGIETRSMFGGNILRHPAYAKLKKGTQYRPGNGLHNADWILKHSFWISCHPRYSTKDLDYVIKVFNDYYGD